jgi:hypothetical protein
MAGKKIRNRKPKPEVCQWLNLESALRNFAVFGGQTESQKHIKPIHWYVACRLAIEGGFKPEEIVPHPPFVIKKITKSGWLLDFDSTFATGTESTVLGGLKTKDVDVVVTKNGIGPVLAVSCKGATGAYRNLTNRMEEAAGDCTNLHITYPGMVYGYFIVVRANRHAEEEFALGIKPSNDVAILHAGEVVAGIIRFHAALRELSGRRGIRNEVSRYEAATLALVETDAASAGRVVKEYPPSESPLRIERFFETLYARYNERFVYGAPRLGHVTHRLQWSPESPIFDPVICKSKGYPILDYEPRLWSKGQELDELIEDSDE